MHSYQKCLKLLQINSNMKTIPIESRKAASSYFLLKKLKVKTAQIHVKRNQPQLSLDWLAIMKEMDTTKSVTVIKNVEMRDCVPQLASLKTGITTSANSNVSKTKDRNTPWDGPGKNYKQPKLFTWETHEDSNINCVNIQQNACPPQNGLPVMWSWASLLHTCEGYLQLKSQTCSNSFSSCKNKTQNPLVTKPARVLSLTLLSA